jgi:hypothetical protein
VLRTSTYRALVGFGSFLADLDVDHAQAELPEHAPLADGVRRSQRRVASSAAICFST